MKKKYYVQKTEEIEVDEPTFEKLAGLHANHYVGSSGDYQNALDRAEAITGMKTCEGTKDWEVGITAIYTEEGIPVFEMA